jgi:hypothetical protein
MAQSSLGVICLPKLYMKSCAHSRRVRLLAAPLLLAFSIIVVRAAVVSQPEPRPDTPINELSVQAVQILARSADVAKIEVLLTAPQPTYRIVHIADWHYFPREDYRVLYGRVRGEASEEGYSDYVRQVERLQEAQLRLLCWLVDGHGLREVFQEGISASTLEKFVAGNEKSWRKWHDSQSRIRAITSQFRSKIDQMEAQGKDATDLRKSKRDAERYVEWGHSAGCVRELLIIRPTVTLRALEDDDALQKTNHLRPWGPEADEREAAIVRNLLARPGCAVVVLGGGHDLSKHIKRLVGNRCEYVRVIPKGYPNRLVREGRITWVAANAEGPN